MILLQSGEDPRIEHAHEYIEQHRSVLAALWTARAADVAKTSVWEDEQIVLPPDTNDVSNYTEIYVHRGGVIRIPVDEDTVSVKVRYLADRKTQTSTDLMRYQTAVCGMLSFCSVDNDFSIDLSQKKTVQLMNYIEIAISKDVPVLFNGKKSVEFELRVQLSTGEVMLKHYSLDTTHTRQKRFKEYTSYSNWHQCSIPDEQFFPNYWQHDITKDCPVGCGPVAWAMVFGYYDRRSQEKPETYGTGSEGLYRCGSDGTTGNKSCEAPSNSSSDRMKKYIEEINKELGTLCIYKSGATPAFMMDRIKDFFQVRFTYTLIVQPKNEMYILCMSLYSKANYLAPMPMTNACKLELV